MADYSTWSNFEINKAIAKYEYPDCSVVRSSDRLEDVSVIGDNFAKILINYCESISDIWPLIVGNGISTYPVVYKGELRICREWYASLIHVEPRIEVRDNNPLRAAAIVYLMMKEKENVNK